MYTHFLRQAGAKTPTRQVFRQTCPQFAGLPASVKAYTQPLILQPQAMQREEKSAINKAFYNLVLKNNSTYWVYIGTLAFAMQAALDWSTESYVRHYNKGMMYDDVVATFPEIPPNCED